MLFPSSSGADPDTPRHGRAASAAAPLRGRGTSWLIAHRFERLERQQEDDGWGDSPAQDEVGGAEADEGAEELPRTDVSQPSHPRTRVTSEAARSILTRNDSPDVPFEWAINPYRGCEHGCIYCYARPTHSYLNLSPGLDFETQLIAKTHAADLLRQALRRRGYRPSPINLGSATDVYQPIERQWRLTRQLLEVLLEANHPCTLVTKSAGVLRDLDLLAELARRRLLLVFVSVTSLDRSLSRILEPRASAPQRRLEAIGRLAAAGVWVGVNVAPIIPFINEPEIEQILQAAAGAGARSAHWTVVRLPWEVNPLFQHWLQTHFPDRAERVMARIRDLRGGRDYDASFSQRMKGGGLWSELIRQRVEKAAARFGLQRQTPELDLSAFVPPAAGAIEDRLSRAPAASAGQGRLF